MQLPLPAWYCPCLGSVKEIPAPSRQTPLTQTSHVPAVIRSIYPETPGLGQKQPEHKAPFLTGTAPKLTSPSRLCPPVWPHPETSRTTAASEQSQTCRRQPASPAPPRGQWCCEAVAAPASTTAPGSSCPFQHGCPGALPRTLGGEGPPATGSTGSISLRQGEVSAVPGPPLPGLSPCAFKGRRLEIAELLKQRGS